MKTKNHSPKGTDSLRDKPEDVRKIEHRSSSGNIPKKAIKGMISALEDVKKGDYIKLEKGKPAGTLSDKIAFASKHKGLANDFIITKDIKDFIQKNSVISEEEGKSFIVKNTFQEGFEFAVNRLKKNAGKELI